MLWQQASRYCWSAKSYDYFIMVVKWLILYFPNVPCILMAVFIFLLVYQTILALYMILQKWRNDQHNIIQNQFNLTFSGTTENDNGCTGEATTTRWSSKREWFRRSWLNLLQFSFLHFPEKTRACSHLTRRRRRRVWRHHLRTTLCSGAAKQYQSRSRAAHRLPKTPSCSSGACYWQCIQACGGAYTVLSHIMEASTWLDFWLSPICWWGNLNLVSKLYAN